MTDTQYDDDEMVRVNDGYRPWGDLKAATRYRDSVKPKAATNPVAADEIATRPMTWHGWVIVEAFFKGIDHQKARGETAIEEIKTAVMTLQERLLPVKRHLPKPFVKRNGAGGDQDGGVVVAAFNNDEEMRHILAAIASVTKGENDV